MGSHPLVNTYPLNLYGKVEHRKGLRCYETIVQNLDYELAGMDRRFHIESNRYLMIEN